MSRNAPQQPISDLTPATIDLQSTAGFASGELIYTKSGTNGPIPTNALVEAPFDISTVSPRYAATQGGFQFNVGSSGSKSKCAATLTNGNTVRVYIKTNSRPAFTVTDPANAVVVADTEITSTFTCGNRCPISVAALSGGGFVAAWNSDSNSTICFAIYSNTGSLVTAATSSSGFTPSTESHACSLALPNGGFVLAGMDGSNNVSFRIFGSTGTAVSSWTATGTGFNAKANIGLAARSDSSFIVFTPNDATGFRYLIINSTGGTIVGATIINPTAGSSSAVTRCNDVSTMSDGTTFVLFYNACNGTTGLNIPCYRFLPTGNVLGTEFAFPVANINRFWVNSQDTTSQASPTSYNVLGLPGNRFIAVFADSQRALNYFVGDSSGALVTGQFPYEFPAIFLPNWKVVSIVTSGSFIDLYFSLPPDTDGPGNSYPTSSMRINASTFRAVPAGTSTTNVVGSSTAPVSSYQKSDSGPSYARFLASANSTLTTDVSMSIVSQQNTLTAAFCDGISCTTLTNGNYVVAYREQTSFTNFAVIISPSGTVLQRITVGLGVATQFGAANFTTICALTGGGFAVTYMSASNVLTSAIYNSAGVQTGTGTITAVSASDAIDSKIDSTGLTNNRFAVAYRNTSSSAVAVVFDSTGTQVAFLNPSFNSASFIAITGLQAGGVALCAYSGTYGTQAVNFWSNTSGNTFTNRSTWQFGSTENNPNRQIVASPAGYVVVSNDSNPFGMITFPSLPSASVQNTSGSGQPGAGSTHIGMTGSGSLVVIQTASNPPALYALDVGLNAGQNYTSVSPSARLNLSMSFRDQNSSPSANMWFTPGDGYRVGMCCYNASRQATFTIFNAYPYAESSNITAGTSLSAAVPINPGTSGPLNGYCLQGVSITSAAAGGVGKVQTQGQATLNNTYSAAAPATAFDYTSPNGSGVSGVRGTAVGRNVTLLGSK